MTQFTEDVWKALTFEWQTTREVADRTQRELPPETHRAKVRHHLRQLRSRGKVESREVSAFGIKVIQWRKAKEGSA